MYVKSIIQTNHTNQVVNATTSNHKSLIYLKLVYTAEQFSVLESTIKKSRSSNCKGTNDRIIIKFLIK